MEEAADVFSLLTHDHKYKIEKDNFGVMGVRREKTVNKKWPLQSRPEMS